MNKKLLLSLLVLVAVLAASLAIFVTGNGFKAEKAGEVFLQGLSEHANDLQQIEFRFADDQPGFTIRRNDDAWFIDARAGYQADFDQLAVFVTALSDARIVERKTANPENYGRLGVGDPANGGSGIGVKLRGDGFEHDVIIGKQAHGTYRYLRIAADETSYLVDQDLDVATTPDEWLIDDIVDINADRIRQVTISHADEETIKLQKNSQEEANFALTDIPEGREPSYPAVGNSIAGALAGLTFDEVRKASEGEPSTTVEFETWDGLRIVISIAVNEGQPWLSFVAETDTTEHGEEDDSASVSEVDALNTRLGGWQYRVADYKQNLFTRRWEDLLKDKQDTN